MIDTPERRRRLARYTELMTLYERGVAQRATARRLHLARNTVRDYVRADSFPESRRRVPRRSALTPFKEYLKRRFHEGCTNAARLWQGVSVRGYSGSLCTVCRFVSTLRVRLPPELRDRLQRHTSGRVPRARLPAALSKSPREVMWLLLRRPGELKIEGGNSWKSCSSRARTSPRLTSSRSSS